MISLLRPYHSQFYNLLSYLNTLSHMLERSCKGQLLKVNLPKMGQGLTTFEYLWFSNWVRTNLKVTNTDRYCWDNFILKGVCDVQDEEYDLEYQASTQ